MAHVPDDNTIPEPDILALVLDRVRACIPALTEESARVIEQQIRAEYGGQRGRIPKRSKWLTQLQRDELFKDGASEMETQAIVNKHKISRATLYRQMKKGGGRFSGG